MYNKIAIGIDQSYTRSGISIAADGKLLKVSSIDYKGLTSKSDKRRKIRNIVIQVITKNQHKSKQMVIICERIRTFSHHAGPTQITDDVKPGQFISTNYIKATGALIATIVDTAAEYGVKVYSADTRAWKAQVVGPQKKGAVDKKLETIKFVTSLGFDVSLGPNKKGIKQFNDDAADSACIALYAFVDIRVQKLTLEE